MANMNGEPNGQVVKQVADQPVDQDVLYPQEQTDPRLVEARERIDTIDAEIVRLLNERAKESMVIRDIKAELGVPVMSYKREGEVLTNVENANEGPLTTRQLGGFFLNIIDMSRRIQRGKEDVDRPRRDVSSAVLGGGIARGW